MNKNKKDKEKKRRREEEEEAEEAVVGTLKPHSDYGRSSAAIFQQFWHHCDSSPQWSSPWCPSSTVANVELSASA